MAIVREVSNLPDGINPNPDVHIPTARESSPSLASRFVATGGIITTSAPAFEGTQTWNNGAVTFTGLKFNVTDTASASGSLLMDLQVGGVSQLKASKDGEVTAVSRFVAPFYYVNSNTGAIFFGASLDAVIQRDGAANTLAMRNGTAAQKLNIYNTYTDASNYERGYSRWNAGVFEFGMETAGTGTAKHTRINRASGANLYLGDWTNNSSGHFLASVDNTYDIGASGANRPRSLYVANIGSFGNYVSSFGMYPGGSSRTLLSSATDAVLRIANNAGTITTDITLSGASGTGTSTATFGGSIVSGGNVQAVSAGGFSWLGGKGGITQVTDGAFTFSNNAGSNSVSLTVGASNLLTLNGGLKTTGATFALQTATTLTDNAAAQVATMTNGPTAGNPTKWIAINDNGVTRYIPAW